MPIEKLDEFAKNGQKSTEGIILENGFPQEEKPARQWFNYIFNAISIKTNELIDSSQTNADAISGINTEIEDLNLARFDTGISVSPTYPEQVNITQSEKNSEYLSFEQFGAIGDGVTDDTSSIEKALNSGAPLFSSNKDFVFSGDLDELYSYGIIGGGNIIYKGYKYPIVKNKISNQLWQGELLSWDKAYSQTLSTNGRTHLPIGVTHARVGFVGEAVVSSSKCFGFPAMRLQRANTSNTTAVLNTVFTMSQEETLPLLGSFATFQYNLNAGDDYSGNNVSISVQKSSEPQQPIINQYGEYSSSFTILENKTHKVEARNKNTPYFITFFVPEDTVQLSFKFDFNFSGTASSNDYIEVFQTSLAISEKPFLSVSCSRESLEAQSRKRYQSSYPYGAISATTDQGTVQAICTSDSSTFSAIMNVRFQPKMVVCPNFYFQSPTSGVKFRIKNMRTGTHIGGTAYELSESGVTIANNGTVIAGDRLICHYVAECLI